MQWWALALLPTHVGVILLAFPHKWGKAAAPHTRGGDPWCVCQTFLTDLRSPHTWGEAI